MAYKLRIKFSKYAHMIFIGHLDLMRYFQKAIRRAKIDISYSAGFSPHQIISFAQPLGVGVYSGGEYMDISVESLTDSAQLQEALQAQMAEGVDILSVRLLPEKAENAMASITAASYGVSFREGREPAFDLGDAVERFMAQDVIEIEKVTKKGSRMVDLKEHIYRMEAGDGSVTMLVDASSGGNIKPALVMEQLYGFAGAALGEFDLIIKREDMFTGSADSGGYRSLGEVGSIY